MKPEAVKYLFDCYLKEKNCTNSYYDVVDGVFHSQARLEKGNLSGESGFAQYDRCEELKIAQGGCMASLPYEEHYDPLGAEQQQMLRQFGRQLSNMSDEFDELFLPKQTIKGKFAFQFEKKCWFVSPSSEIVEIPVIRVGNADEECSVKWKTRDKTALADVNYIEATDEVLFKKGETKKYIQVVLLENKIEDLCFTIELESSNSEEIGSINPITIYITDHDHLYDDEKNVIENIVESRRFSFMNVASCLTRKVTVNTFKTALMYLCGNADSLIQEFAYAFELVRIALPSSRRETLMRIVCNFFQQAPEAEDLKEYIDGSLNEEDSPSSKED